MIDLSIEPELIDTGEKKEKHRFDIIDRFSFESVVESRDIDFISILNSRHSERSFIDTSIEDIYPLFHHVNRTTRTIKDPFGNRLEKRNYPSPGSVCSIHCLVSKLGCDDWYIYDSYSSTLNCLGVLDDSIKAFKDTCGGLIGVTHGAWIIWYICDFSLLNIRYKNAETLALRECGHIGGIQSLAAEYLGLGFCTLGYTGYDLALNLSNDRQFRGVGTAIVGRKI